jgi:hypothetical protein
MKPNEAKQHYHAGELKGFRAIRDSEPGCWLLVIEGLDGQTWTLESMLGTQRSFMSMDTLVSEVESITGHVNTISFCINAADTEMTGELPRAA